MTDNVMVTDNGMVTDNVIELQSVRKQFGDYVAVEHADFSIAQGEFFSLLGPSGCGKTTLLKMIAGFEQPTSGSILLEGTDVSTVPPYKRSVNTVFQQYALFPHMSVLDNVAFGLRSKGMGAADARRQAAEMLEIVRLDEFGRRRPYQLSGGQQQRVALARALVNKPSALLLDEPLAALDLKLREAMQLELKRIQRELAITFVFVTHDQGEALTMSDRIAVMSSGRVEQIGTPEEIYGRPASIFVAGFIGSANLLPGTVSPSGASVDLDMGATIDVADTNGQTPGTEVTVMLRPERLVPYSGDLAPSKSVVGRIKEVIYQGSEVRLIIDLDAMTEIVATIEPDDMTPLVATGNLITLSWVPEAPFVMPGRSAIVGATGTDFDEVQATMDGKELARSAGADDGPKINRRALLIGGGVVGVGALGAIALSSLGGNDSSTGSSGTETDEIAGGGVGQGSSAVRIINWTEYIDTTGDGEVGTIDRFSDESGVAVTYSETWNDNEEAYGKEFAAYLDGGNPVPWDIAMPTYWMAARLKSKGWISPLPFNLIPNYQNLEPSYLNLGWDRGAKYHLPWQAGFTGFAYNIDITGRELKSFSELLTPEFAGRIGFFTEMRDTLGLVMLAQGNDPASATEDTMNQALDTIEELTTSGHVRRFTGNDYLEDIQSGNFAACVAWSGDIAQAENPSVRFVFPEEGAMSWFDTMVIPIGADNGVAAARWMNYVYDPVNAAKITAWVQYVSPVVGVRDELVKLGGDSAALADSPLLFPDDATKANSFVFADMEPELDRTITERFITIAGG